LIKVKKRFSKFTINGASTNSLLQSLAESEEAAMGSSKRSSPKSVSGTVGNSGQGGSTSNLKKRRFRQLERFDIFDNDIDSQEN
jgi:hypothetical protein